MNNIEGFADTIDLHDLHSLTIEEKTELWKILNSIGQGALMTESTLSSRNDLSQKNEIMKTVQDMKNKFISTQNNILRASGFICKDPTEIRERSQRNLDNTEDILKSNIQEIGLEYGTPTPGNGNCFFEAVVDQMRRLNLTVMSAYELRLNVINFCRDNPTLQREDGEIDIKDFVDDRDPHKYLAKMSKQGEWADHVVVMFTSAYLQRDILVVTSSPNTDVDNNILWITSGKAPSGDDPILLGHIWENHYQSLRPVVMPSVISSSEDKQTEAKDNSFNKEVVNDYCEDSNYIKDKPFVHLVKSVYLKTPRNNVVCLVQRVRAEAEEETIITRHLMELDESLKGTFCVRHGNRATIQFKCERSGQSTGKNKNKGPFHTRANNCRAYISFQFLTHMNKRAVIIRQNLHHNGHNMKNQKEMHHSRPHPSLIEYVNSLLDQNIKPMEIMCKVWKWARDQGKYNIHDRKYYLTPTDIKYLCQKYKSDKRLHHSDAVAVHELCTDVLKENIVFYQELIQGKQPLIIVYQNKDQCERMNKLSKNVVFLDATYKGLTAYGYTFYALVGRENQNRGSPLAYCISSDDTSDVVKTFLEALKVSAHNSGFIFNPRSFMVDRDTKEISAIKTVFPNSCILLCWFHVLQAIYRYLNKKDSGISGSNYAESRKKVVAYIRTMKLCSTEADFSFNCQKLKEEMPTEQVTDYLLQNWCNTNWGPFWSNYGRHFFHEDQDTNNLVERFFLAIKYHFLGGYINHRIEDLLLLLNGNITTFYNYMDDLAKAGRLKTGMTQQKGKLKAENMLLAGMDKSIQWTTSTECKIPSQTTPGTFYYVDVVNVMCNCPASTIGGMCKHVHLGLLVAASRNVDVEKERAFQANQIFDTSQYYYDTKNNQIEIFMLSGSVSVVNVTSKSCSCFAYSHGIQCVCTLVAQKVIPKSDNNIETDTNEECMKPPINNESTTDEKIKRKLNQINAFITNPSFKDLSAAKKKEVLVLLERVYALCSVSNFDRLSRKRKQQPLFQNRKKKCQKTEEHAYSTPKKTMNKKYSTKLNEDGSFKKTGRSKQAVRKPFQS